MSRIWIVLLVMSSGPYPAEGWAQYPLSLPSEASTSATGRRTVQPDHATLVLQFHELSPTTREAGARITERTALVRHT